MGTTCRVPACLLWAYAKITLPITRQCFDGINAAGYPFHMLRHHSPLLSSKLICTITAIITQNLGCGNYTCTIISLFWIDLCAGVLKYGVKHVNGSRESCIGKQCMRALSALFMRFPCWGSIPKPLLEHDEIMQLCCATSAQRWSTDGWISAGLELRIDIQ